MATPPNHDVAGAYRERFRRVLDYVDRHLEDELTLEHLSRVAAFSKFHFARQFAALFGIGVHEYVRLIRLKRASYELAFRRDGRVIDVALASGYESHEAFARAFKKTTSQTPSEFRDFPEWNKWHETYGHLREIRREHMKPEHRPEHVEIVDFPRTRVAVLEHRGDPKLIGNSIRTFIEWRRQNGLSPKVSATFNLLYGDPDETPPQEFRLDLCAAIDRPVPENTHGILERTIPEGRCAVIRHVGSDDTFRETFEFLYSTWLPRSGEEPRDFPLFLKRVRMFPDVPEHEAVTDVFLPIR